MMDAPLFDWMEWQAGYVCGAILMPAGSVRNLVSDYRKEHSMNASIAEESEAGQGLISGVAGACDVSKDAARVRLLKLHHMVAGKTAGALY